MTKSNDKDPWIGGETTPSPEPKAEAKAEESAEPEEATKASEITESPEAVVEPEKIDESTVDGAETAEASEAVDESSESDDDEMQEGEEGGAMIMPLNDEEKIKKGCEGIEIAESDDEFKALLGLNVGRLKKAKRVVAERRKAMPGCGSWSHKSWK